MAITVGRVGGVCAPKSYCVTNSRGEMRQGSDGGWHITESREILLRIHNQCSLLGTYFRIDRGHERFANGVKQKCRLTIRFVIKAQEMRGWERGEPQAQCARSATVWASGRTRDPYFEILGVPRGIMVTPSGGFDL